MPQTRNILTDRLRLHTATSKWRLHRFIHFLLGWPTPRRYIFAMSERRRDQLMAYAAYMWQKANDNTGMRRVERPVWFPKKYIYGELRTRPAIRG